MPVWLLQGGKALNCHTKNPSSICQQNWNIRDGPILRRIFPQVIPQNKHTMAVLKSENEPRSKEEREEFLFSLVCQTELIKQNTPKNQACFLAGRAGCGYHPSMGPATENKTRPENRACFFWQGRVGCGYHPSMGPATENKTRPKIGRVSFGGEGGIRTRD